VSKFSQPLINQSELSESQAPVTPSIANENGRFLDQSEDMEEDFHLANQNSENFLPPNQILEKNTNISNSFQILRSNSEPDVTNTIHPNDPVYSINLPTVNHQNDTSGQSGPIYVKGALIYPSSRELRSQEQILDPQQHVGEGSTQC